MPRVVDKRSKARAIAGAALRTFKDMGYHRARMADIARAAGVGKGTVYEYFSDKADILRFLFEDYFGAFKQGVLRAAEAQAQPAARLLAVVEFAFDHVAEWEDHCSVYVDYFGAARAGEEKLISLVEIYDEMGGLLRRLVEEGKAAGEISADVEPVAASDLLLSVFDGIVLHRIFAGRSCSREALRDAALQLLTDGLLARRSSCAERSRSRRSRGERC